MGAATLFVCMVAGSFGMGYFVYGKKPSKTIPLAAGILLLLASPNRLHLRQTQNGRRNAVVRCNLMIAASNICVVLMISPFVIKT